MDLTVIKEKLEKSSHGSLNGVDEMIIYANEMYRIGEPVISDEEYDFLLSFTDNISDGNPKVMDYTHNGKPLRELPITMGSLDKIKTDEEIKKWLERCKDDDMLVITPKYDGISICVEFSENGQYTAFSRGTGTEGFDITSFVEVIGIPTFEKGVYFGEIVLKREALKEINKLREERGLLPYKNTRNTVAGLMSMVDPDEDFLPYLSVIFYGKGKTYEDKHQTLDFIKDFTLDSSLLAILLPLKRITKETLDSIFEDFRETLDIDIDGLVLDIDNKDSRKALKSSSLNPAYAVAYKGFPQKSYPTKVKFIHRTLSKDGIFVPTLVIEPVEIGGVIIRNLYADSESFLYLYSIGEGTNISIIRSGDVIPRIVKVEDFPVIENSLLKKLRQKYSDNLSEIRKNHISTPDNYSEPKLDLPYYWDSTNTQIKTDIRNENIDIKNLVHFFKEIGVKGVSDAKIEDLYKNGFSTLRKIYKASVSSLSSLPNWGETSAISFKNEIEEKLSSASEEMIMSGSNLFFRLGAKTLKPITEYLHLEDEEFKTKLETIPGYGFFTKTSILEGIPKYKKFKEDISEFIKEKKIENKVLGDKYKDMKFVFTGVRDKELEKYIESEGGQITTSVSSSTSYVICASKDNLSGKIKKATELEVPIIEYKEAKMWMPNKNKNQTLF